MGYADLLGYLSTQVTAGAVVVTATAVHKLQVLAQYIFFCSVVYVVLVQNPFVDHVAQLKYEALDFNVLKH